MTIYQKIRISALLKAGLSYSNIRKQLGVSNGCISNVNRKLKKKLPLENCRGQGRKKATTSEEDRELIVLMKRNRRKTSKQLATEWNSSIGKSISPRTVRRRLLDAGYKSYTVKPKPARKPQHHTSHFKFARKHLRWDFGEWKNVVFSDESHFEVFTRKNRSYVRRLPSEADRPFSFQPRMQCGGGSVSVFGCMTAEGVGPLVFYDGRMDGENYVKILETELVPYVRKTFENNIQWVLPSRQRPLSQISFHNELVSKNLNQTFGTTPCIS